MKNKKSNKLLEKKSNPINLNIASKTVGELFIDLPTLEATNSRPRAYSIDVENHLKRLINNI